MYGTLTQLRRNLENFVKVYFLLVINVGLKYSFLTTLESLLICFKFHHTKESCVRTRQGAGKANQKHKPLSPTNNHPALSPSDPQPHPQPRSKKGESGSVIITDLPLVVATSIQPQ